MSSESVGSGHRASSGTRLIGYRGYVKPGAAAVAHSGICPYEAEETDSNRVYVTLSDEGVLIERTQVEDETPAYVRRSMGPVRFARQSFEALTGQRSSPHMPFTRQNSFPGESHMGTSHPLTSNYKDYLESSGVMTPEMRGGMSGAADDDSDDDADDTQEQLVRYANIARVMYYRGSGEKKAKVGSSFRQHDPRRNSQQTSSSPRSSIQLPRHASFKDATSSPSEFVVLVLKDGGVCVLKMFDSRGFERVFSLHSGGDGSGTHRGTPLASNSFKGKT